MGSLWWTAATTPPQHSTAGRASATPIQRKARRGYTECCIRGASAEERLASLRACGCFLGLTVASSTPALRSPRRRLPRPPGQLPRRFAAPLPPRGLRASPGPIRRRRPGGENACPPHSLSRPARTHNSASKHDIYHDKTSAPSPGAEGPDAVALGRFHDAAAVRGAHVSAEGALPSLLLCRHFHLQPRPLCALPPCACDRAASCSWLQAVPSAIEPGHEKRCDQRDPACEPKGTVRGRS